MRFAPSRLGPFFEGKMLVAAPGHNLDSDFDGAIVYLCSHNEEGAMGIVVNKLSPHRSISEVLRQLDIVSDEEAILVGSQAHSTPVVSGGPNDKDRGFVLHSSDFSIDAVTTQINEAVHMTASVDILKAIAEEKGPTRAVLAFGYAQWAPTQLEREIRDNDWLVCGTDIDILFGIDYPAKYGLALGCMGIRDSNFLSSVCGRA